MPLLVMESLPFGRDNDCTQPLDSDDWLASVSIQQLLAKEGEASSAAPLGDTSDPASAKAEAGNHGSGINRKVLRPVIQVKRYQKF